jgi:NAD(P)-dependent dehydrogenase (short-subunit alcohol dehydrogenase family)
MPESTQPVWFITGGSSGLGREIARHTLSLGYPTVVTAPDVVLLKEFTAQFGANVLGLKLEVTCEEDINAAVAAATHRFGRIDVLVNNAGIAHFGFVEDSDLGAVRTLFNINLWGGLAMTRAVLPGMRRQRAGTIVNVTSMAGFATFPASGYYCASKFAVEAWSEALAQEVLPLGLKVLIAEPGGFRSPITEGPLASFVTSPISEDYRELKESVVRHVREAPSKAIGDPARMARALVEAVAADNPPLRLLLGTDALRVARAKLGQLTQDIDRWAAVSASTDYPKGQ